MTPIRTESLEKIKEPIFAANYAMANCVLHDDIMLCILKRLPVKSILRFKSVCKPWRELFSTPEFIKMHHGQSSSDPKNQSFIVHRSNILSLFNIESNEKPTYLQTPYSYYADTVGSCNGLLCMSFLPFGQVIVLWNPATMLSMSVPLLNVKVDFGVPRKVSLGFGYDAEGTDFKVVRIVSFVNKKEGKNMRINWVDVYSVNSDSWRSINVDFQFSVLRTKNDVIVKGNPYWVVKFDENESGKSDLGEILVCFDVTKLIFKIVPLSTLYMEAEAQVKLVDWDGSLGALVCTKGNKRVESLDVWVFDDGEQIWRKNRTFGPIEVHVDKFLHCSKNGKILGELPDGKLFVFDPKTGCVKVLFYDTRPIQSCEIYGYSESLAYIKGFF